MAGGCWWWGGARPGRCPAAVQEAGRGPRCGCRSGGARQEGALLRPVARALLSEVETDDEAAAEEAPVEVDRKAIGAGEDLVCVAAGGGMGMDGGADLPHQGGARVLCPCTSPIAAAAVVGVQRMRS
ncbi:hypothetical protein EASAB2608_00199 [Streptomyces sp. EAS-AB2608]|nr:hypothetical protein EASAB2608_00199 [Streptomyces sp. EAS-AB2608]